MDSKHLNTVKLDSERCKGCVACMKRCPTEAIRVRNGKAKVDYDKCVACGECVRMCAQNAKKAVYDSFDCIDAFKYKVALPAPSLYGQFNNLIDVDFVLDGLIKLGFDDVYEVGCAAEQVTNETIRILNEQSIPKPVISSACPAVVELILIKYPSLAKHLLPVIAPVDVAAINARKIAVKKSGLNPEEIGIFFISPCPAKVFAIKEGIGLDSPVTDGVLSVSEVYLKLVPIMNKIDTPNHYSKLGVKGLNWSGSGGEAIGLNREKYIAADGIENVVKILGELEDGKLMDIDFIELNACNGGCVGGVLNIENPYVAKARLRALRKYLPPESIQKCNTSSLMWTHMPQPHDEMKLADNVIDAMQMLRRKANIMALLPGIDCGACGAPSCEAFAEDVARGEIDINACVKLEINDENK